MGRTYVAVGSMFEVFLESNTVRADFIDLLLLGILSNAVDIGCLVLLISVVNFFNYLAIVCIWDGKEL